jgi:hypothetical protein
VGVSNDLSTREDRNRRHGTSVDEFESRDDHASGRRHVDRAFVFNQFGDLERVILRRDDRLSARFRRRMLLPVFARHRESTVPRFFRGATAPASPEVIPLRGRRALGCMGDFRRPKLRHERLDGDFQAFRELAACLICANRVERGGAES